MASEAKFSVGQRVILRCCSLHGGQIGVIHSLDGEVAFVDCELDDLRFPAIVVVGIDEIEAVNDG